MFDIGFWELAVIGVIALLVVGPERMPGLIRTTGKWAGQIQRLARDLRREIEREAQTEEFRKLNQDFLEEDRRLKASVREATRDAPPQPAAPMADTATEGAAETAEEPAPDDTTPVADGSGQATTPDPEEQRTPSHQNA